MTSVIEPACRQDANLVVTQEPVGIGWISCKTKLLCQIGNFQAVRRPDYLHIPEHGGPVSNDRLAVNKGAGRVTVSQNSGCPTIKGLSRFLG